MAARAMHTEPATQAVSTTADESWLESLFRAHYPAVVRHARALGVDPAHAEDVAQQVFMIAARRRDQLHPDRSAAAWLFGITRRACANHRRGRAREQARRRRAEPPSDYRGPHVHAERSESAALLQAFLDRLSERHRVVFVLVEIEGHDVPQAAALTELPTKTVHAYLRTARKHMARMIARHQRRTGEGA